MKNSKSENTHTYNFVQNGGLIQPKISTIEDVLNLDKLDQKLWTALACPVNGLEFSYETLEFLDLDHNGRVRASEVLAAVDFIKKYLAKPEIIMEDGKTIPLDALSETPFASGKSPLETANSVLSVLKKASSEISLEDVNAARNIFSKQTFTQNNLIKKECINNKEAAELFLSVKDKIQEYFTKCSLIKFDENVIPIFKAQNDGFYANGDLDDLPLQICEADRPLNFKKSFNPVWNSKMNSFYKLIIVPIYGEIEELTEDKWNEIEQDFSNFDSWEKSVSDDVMLNACEDLKKLILYRQNLVTLLKNFVSFENFYDFDKKAIFQAGTLFIDGRACDLCFKVLDIAKHGTMASLSQCFLVYCDCVKQNSAGEKMQIAALVSNGPTDNLITGRNGVFYDRNGGSWDATIVKIIENPISIKQAFWSPYKRLGKMIQEKIAKSTMEAEKSVFDKMTKAVDNPKAAASSLPAKKTDVGTVAALSVAFTGIATVAGGLLEAFFGLGAWIPLGIAGIILVISLPSMLIAWRKLRQRNIAPILDASGWAVNGNVKIPALLGDSLTRLPQKPASAYLSSADSFISRKHPVRTLIIWIIVLLVIALCVYLGIKNPEIVNKICDSFKSTFIKK